MNWISAAWRRVRAIAGRRALIAFGGVDRVKGRTRDEFRPALVEDTLRDLRYGARALRRAPTFTIVAALTLALGIGATTAGFSVVNGVLIKPLPYPDAGALVSLWYHAPSEASREKNNGRACRSLAPWFDVRIGGQRIMRKIVSGLFISLDGVVESPEQWHFPYFNDEMGAAVGAQSNDAGTILLGRVTYQAFAAFWPDKGSDVPFADHLNNTPKLVASTTLDTVEWRNSTLIRGDVAKELTALKQGSGKDVSIIGSAALVRSLLRDDVLDELRLLVHPIVVGRGKRLFDDGMEKKLKLVESTTFKTGVLNLIYQRA